ncbi:MAG: HYR domain-containing protein [Bacteroidia bacterium]
MSLHQYHRLCPLRTFTAPVGTDNCPGSSTSQTGGPASGSSFPVGTTVNTFRVTDAQGRTATCSFNVTVSDVQAPTITCPANLSVNNTSGLCSGVATFSTPSGTDNCAGVTSTQTSGIASGGTYPLGPTTNVFRATDAAGNTGTCSFTVTVVDAQAPSITCPANGSVTAGTGACSATYTYTAPTGTDNCAGSTTTQTGGLASGATYPLGVTTNVFRVTDAAGNTTTCSFTVTVGDAQAPAITCPANGTATAVTGTCAATFTYTAPVGTDNCAGVTTTQTAGSASGASFPVGVTTNTFRATDAAGNTTTCSFTVTITDGQAPSISCPSNASISTTTGACTGTFTYTSPTGTDNCAGVTSTQTAGLASGSAFPLGVTTNTFRATDAAGNTSTCSFTVTVADGQAPTVTCPANASVNATSGTCSATYSFTAPTGTDNCSGSTTAQAGGLASGSTYPLGATVNTFQVTDAAGNTGTCSFTVTVNDGEAPSITCPANGTANATSGTCAGTFTYTAPTGSDNCAGVTTTQTAGLASGATYPVGTTVNTFRATDAAGNSTTCSFNVVIADAEAPSINCPPSFTANVDPGNCSAVIPYATPSGADNCAGVTVSQTAGLPSNTAFPVGATTCTFRATDASGNSTTCSFVATVVDNIAPTITCPSNVSANAATGTCAATVSYALPTGSDNCPGTTGSILSGSAPGSSFPVGTTTNTFQLADAAGNTATCSFNVVVVDAELPAITCPGNVTVNNATGSCSATATFVAPVGTTTTVVCYTAQTGGLPSGSTFLSVQP